MRLVDIQWHPTARQLRQFAACASIILPLVAWWSSIAWTWILVIAVISLALNVCAWLAPQIVRPVFIGAMLITLPIGLVVGELALLLIYFGVFMPIGLIFKLIGRDALRLNRGNRESYWETRKPAEKKGYFRQW